MQEMPLIEASRSGMRAVEELEARLNDHDAQLRAAALTDLAALAEQGRIPLRAESAVANAYGHSPLSLAWLARKQGYRLLGIVDFDVLDGVDEFLEACDLLGVRGTAGIETRVFVPEFASREINSPGEPGICYHMGIGFTSSSVPHAVAPLLADLRQGAARRNRAIVEQVNAYLDPVTVDYEEDVLPLTPAGTATERHLVLAYLQAAERITPDPAAFWATKLDTPVEEVRSLRQHPSALQSCLRSRLMKRGGAGYVQPDHGAFPSVERFHQLIVACGALPCAAWLDGTSAGEQACGELLELLISKGVVALNLIPDRNWNVPDPVLRRVKVQNLYQVVGLAQELALPLNIGTEMNSHGQKLVDDFHVPELAPVRRAFLEGAHFVCGHTVLQRAAGLGYQSEWAKTYLPGRRARNGFYTHVGHLLPPGRAGTQLASTFSAAASPEAILDSLKRRSH
jgi:hypothetical protein